jgi:hypothetical protein
MSGVEIMTGESPSETVGEAAALTVAGAAALFLIFAIFTDWAQSASGG